MRHLNCYYMLFLLRLLYGMLDFNLSILLHTFIAYTYILFQAKFVIDLERNLNTVPYLKTIEDECLVEFPARKKSVFQKVSDVVFFGGDIDAVDGERAEIEQENDVESSLEDQIEIKLENFRFSLRHEFREIQDNIKGDLEEKLGRILEKLK